MLKKFLPLLLIFLFSGFSHASERITDFAVSAQINADGSVEITESISVVAEHRKIRKGIYRDIPTAHGERIRDIALWMDDYPHPFFTQRQMSGLRVNFGNDDFIPQGPHTYQFRYTMTNVVRLFKNHDEFYWNVTGSQWDFPIERAAISVTLPESAIAEEARISSYVGARGTRGIPAKRQGLFFQTGRIDPGEDFTIAIPWQKGVVAPSTDYYLRYWPLLALLLGAVALGIYYKWAWEKVGQDPQSRVVTQYAPPENISPAQMKYIYDMGATGDFLPIILVSLAMKGAITIEQQKHFLSKDVFIIRSPAQPTTPLSAEEASVLSNLFLGKTRIKINDRANIPVFTGARKHLLELLKNHAEPYFSTNFLYNLPTYLYLAVGSFLIFTGDAAKITLIILIMLVGCLGQARWTFKKSAPLVMLIVFLTFCQVAELADLFSDNLIVSYGAGILLVTAVAGGLFQKWVKAYTPFGRELMDHIEGFKRYMEVGESGRVAASDPTDELRIFCDYLPYAYAFGIQSKWMKLFENKFTSEQIHGAMASHGFTGLSAADGFTAVSSSLSSLSASVSSGSGGGGGGGR